MYYFYVLYYIRKNNNKTQIYICTVGRQIKLGQKWQSHKSKFINLHRLIMALSQIG
jgi:hypothetical protein